MEKLRQPSNAKGRADHIGDLVSDACEELLKLSTEWFELNDPEGLSEARRLLDAKRVEVIVIVSQESSGLAHISLNLVRTDAPMPRPFFEVRVPMLPSTLR